MRHLARLGLLLFAGLLALALVRYASSRTTVSLIGLVRGDNAAQWASLEPRLGPSQRCVSCHQDVELEWSRSAHTGQSCEACHGAGDAHIGRGLATGPARELCVTCHSSIPGRPKSFPQVNLEEHYPLQACTDCHNPHSPAAAFPLIPHQVQGREDCLACHGDPRIARLPPNHAFRPVEVCLGCHKPKEDQR
ncbi:MAG TPA: cytochrome c3 family protein [Dehalococcoidia bacterium]|nr:cytochrome c3 family protein [Dehalococcoidia bacterium]